MKRLMSIAIILVACMILGLSFDPMIKAAQADTNSLPPVPPPDITSEIPHNLDINKNAEYPELMQLGLYGFFNNFAWQTFVALNWPSDCNGQPLQDINEAPNAPRIWESYNTPEEIFLNSSQKSNKHSNCQSNLSELNLGQEIQAAEGLAKFEEYEKNVEGLTNSEKPQNNDDKSNYKKLLAAIKNPLVDQQGNYVISEIRLNPVESQQIIDNKWYEVEALDKFDNDQNSFNFACSSENNNITSKVCQNKQAEGAIEIKAAWRVFDPRNNPESGDKYIAVDKSRYFTTKRNLIIPAKISSTGEQLNQTFEVGLIGFHIVQKTSNNGWIWSTFEQIDNAPGCDNKSAGNYTLYNSQCQDCRNNRPTATKPYIWADKPPYALKEDKTPQTPAQICRELKLAEDNINGTILAKINENWQSQLKSSVWQYYKLIGVQWLDGFKFPYKESIRNIQPTGLNLANLTLEPFVQSIACIQCHTSAKLPTSNAANADFSFVMNKELEGKAAH